MKLSSTSFAHIFQLGLLTVIGLFALPQTAEAKGPKYDKHHRSQHDKKNHSNNDDHSDNGRDRQVYSSHPRSGFVLSLGTGYAGRGYYYGPPNSPYYYQRSDVRYYATRESAPREYYSSSGSYRSHSSDASVQRALARRGYYQGSYDGDIGPQSRRAIVRYQRDQGLQETGYITSVLLRSLGL